MRILIVSQFFHPENFRVNQMATALKSRGHDVVILTAQPNYPSGRFFKGYGFCSPWNEKYNGMTVLRVPIIARGRGRFWELALNYSSFIIFAVFFGLPRLRGQFDLCFAWCSSPITGAIPAVVLRIFRRIPVAIWVQDLWPETFFAVTKSQNPLLKRLLIKVVHWIYSGVDQIWTQSEAYEESVLRHGGRAEQIKYVPNWAEDFYDCHSSSWLSQPAEQIPRNSLVFAGNLGRAQGIENILDAAELVRFSSPSAHWIFVGDGALRNWLGFEIERRQLSGQITLLARRPAAEVTRILKAASALLITLDNDPVYAQTVPSKVQSCLAAGRPIIAALHGQAAQVLRDANCGLVCQPQDPAALAKSVNDFFSLPEATREQMGRNGHTYYRKYFTEEKVISKIIGLFEQLRKK